MINTIMYHVSLFSLQKFHDKVWEAQTRDIHDLQKVFELNWTECEDSSCKISDTCKLCSMKIVRFCLRPLSLKARPTIWVLKYLSGLPCLVQFLTRLWVLDHRNSSNTKRWQSGNNRLTSKHFFFQLQKWIFLGGYHCWCRHCKS